jgi:hypothetical protein
VTASGTGNATPQTQPKRRGSIPNPLGKERSATPDEDEEDEDEDGDEPRKKKKKGKSGMPSEYKYQSEIAAMVSNRSLPCHLETLIATGSLKLIIADVCIWGSSRTIAGYHQACRGRRSRSNH